MTFEEFEEMHLEDYPYKVDARILAQFAWDHQRKTIDKQSATIAKLKDGIEKVLSYEPETMSMQMHEAARQALKELSEGE